MYSAVARTALVLFRLTVMYSAAGKLLTALVLLTTAFFLMTGASTSSLVHAQSEPDISGTWRGTLIAGQLEPLEIVFNIQGDAGNYSATLDIPSQSRIGLPVDSVNISGSSITLRMDSIQAEYYASVVMEDDGSAVSELNGDWGQSGEHIPLRMQRDKR